MNKEFWLGNDKIHELTKSGDMKLRVELEAWDGRSAWAEYDYFRWVLKIDFNKTNIGATSRVEGEDQEYKLHIGGYTGTAGDSMTGRHPNNGMRFSTRDRDNDGLSSVNCAQSYSGGWWFNR